MKERYILNKIHPFYDGNGRTFKILFANDDIIKKMYRKIKTIYKTTLWYCLNCRKNTEKIQNLQG